MSQNKMVTKGVIIKGVYCISNHENTSYGLKQDLEKPLTS
jgi:hypothetical protein